MAHPSFPLSRPVRRALASLSFLACAASGAQPAPSVVAAPTPSGHVLAWTVFVAGDSYNGGRFSTRVGMLNVATGATVDTLETFAITRDGRPSSQAQYPALARELWEDSVALVSAVAFGFTLSVSVV